MNPLALSRPTQLTDTQGGLTTGLRRFRPRLVLGYQEELYGLSVEIADATDDEVGARIGSAIETADSRVVGLGNAGLSPEDLVPTLQWASALRVLRDLHTQGWQIYTDDEGLLLRAPGSPGSADPETEKEAIRRSFSFARDAQLRESSTVRFIRATERRGIDRVLADGEELAGRIEERGIDAIEPELELVEPGMRDSETGIFLQDLWRYARHFWSIPYQSTPGRNMFYLVRDGASPSRPLIGIAALGNPVLGLAQRDEFAGWNARALAEKLSGFSPRKRNRLARRLFEVLNEGISEIYCRDFWRGIPSDWRAAVAKLEAIEQESADRRIEQLGNAKKARDPEYVGIRAAHTAVSSGREEDVDWEAVAKTALYRRKRASSLADLLRARGTLGEFGGPKPSYLASALASEEGSRSVEVALRRIKQSVIASSVMEVITCGAVPPYREVLGGKLVALLMLSRQVTGDYERKYSSQVSLIASALSGRPVTRPTRLAWLTTSSLYAVGSSQYNRLKVKFGERTLSYRRIGITESFGTVHFAPDTVASLSQLARLVDDNRRRINNLFGEGTSPKLRLVRSGLECLGLNANVFLRHHSPRLLYGASLCSNLSDVLLGLSTTPKYVLPAGGDSTKQLVKHWRDRWFSKRVIRQEILERVRSQRLDQYLLGADPALANGAPANSRGQSIETTPSPVKADAGDQAANTFIERLYRSTKSYADRLSQEELEAIHVDLGADGFLLEEAEANKQIVVTGNPGDGKTHLIERLRPQLEALGAEVITDANACSDEETLKTWRRCKKDKKPFVLAINEWPLYVLQRLARARKFAPVEEALRQVRSARYFVESQQPESPKDGVVTIDLSLRNLLAPAVVGKVIERLTDQRFYAGLDEADPMVTNREALQNPQVAERLMKLLDLAGLRLGHVTMRQLVGFVAYLLSAGQSAADRLKAGQDATGLSYSNLAFEGGVGLIFDAVRQIFDPAALTHPTWDEALWRGETKSDNWIWDTPTGVLALPESARPDGFRAIKRRFFFEHISGDALLDLVPRDEREFEDLLESGAAGRTGLVRDLVLAVNRFYEPDFPEKERDRLLLWQSHRYDVRAPTAFVSLRAVSHQQLRVEPLRYAEWVERWLPPEQQGRRSFSLVASASEDDVAVLEVDRELYLTLLEAQRGLGRSSWSRTATRRITRFVDRLDRAMESTSDVEDVRIRNVSTDLDDQFSVQRDPARYQI